MNPAVIKMKSLLFDVFANGYLWTGVITQWRDGLDYWIKIAVGLSAIALSWVTIYIRLKDKSNKE
jgi:hypothetical protein